MSQEPLEVAIQPPPSWATGIRMLGMVLGFVRAFDLRKDRGI